MARTLQALDEVSVTRLKGVGEARAASLAKLDLHTVLDLLTYYPRRYLDRTNERRIDELDVGEEAMVLVKVKAVHAMRTRSRKAMVTADVTDGSGFLKVTFFNQPYRERQLKPGTQAVLFGKVDLFRGRRQMTNPVVDLVGDKTGRIVPVYPQSEKAGIMSWDVDKWMTEVLERAGEFVDPVPEEVRDRWSLTGRTTAFHDIHQPETMAAAMDARRRLVFDELLRVQLRLVQRKRELERTTPGIVHDVGGSLVRRFHERLPFPLTAAQQRAIDEIDQDLAGPHPMHRLLQGDVGSGKTVVAVSALLVAVQGGHQGALMAPTEVLAEQHYLGVRELLAGFTVPDTDESTLFAAAADGSTLDRELRVELLTNRTTAARAPTDPRRSGRRSGRPGHRDARAHPGVDHVPLAGCRGDRRAAPVRCRAAGRAAGQELGRGRARRAGDDGHADPAHRGDDRLRRPRRLGARRAAAGPHAGRHDLGPRRGRRGRGVVDRPRAGRRRSPGLCRVPADRREREARGALGRGDLRAVAGGGAVRPAPRAAARPGHAGRTREGDGACSVRVASTCWWRRP